MKKLITPFLLVGALASCENAPAPDLYTNYISDGEAHPLVILVGGSDGGNYFANPNMKPLMDRYHDYGFSVASMGYFDTLGTPDSPIELSLNEIDARIKAITEDSSIKGQCVALLGFSKGAELSLLLGSHFNTVNHIVAAYPSHVVWNAVKTPMSYSSWSIDGQPLPYIEAPLLSFDMLSGIFTGEYRNAFTDALSEASPKELNDAAIPVEKISGSVTLVSARQDQIWPSFEMANKIEQRLSDNSYENPVLHIDLDGDHYSYNKETMDTVLTHLKRVMGSECN